MVDFAGEGCAVDYATDRIYCGTNQPDGRTQNTLWALNALNGSLVWSGNAGSVVNRPQLANGKLYVGTRDGTIQAYDPNGDGAGNALRIWSTGVVVPGGIVRNIWPEFRPGGHAGALLVLDTTARLTRFTDQGSSASFDWSIVGPAGTSFTSMGAVDPHAGQAYIGRSDGKLQQIDLVTGATLSVLNVAAGGIVFDPSFDEAFPSPRVAVAGSSTTGVMAQYCAGLRPPPGSCATAADCASWNGPCTQAACDLSSGTCYRLPLPDGSACDDGKSCSTGDACRSGECKANSYSACPCTQTGDAACAAGLTCCGTVCVSLEGDPGHCGGCGTVCQPDQTCTQGSCNVAPAPCGAPTVSTLTSISPSLSGADAIAFDRAASFCSAYVSTYRYPTASVVQRVDPAGGVTTVTSASPDLAPLHGIAAPREGNQVYAAIVNRPSGSVPQTSPGLLEAAFVPAHASVARTAAFTFGAQPFALSIYDQGPVGPALDMTYYSTTGTGRTYFGNWNANGDVVVVQQACVGCPWSVGPVPVSITPVGDRITAIAFAPARTLAPVQHRTLAVGHGAVLSLVDLDTSFQTVVNLVVAAPPPTVSAILGIAVHPHYGDIFVEVSDPAAHRRILQVREDDHSIRNLSDIQQDLRLSPVVPPFFTNDGRLVFQPSGKLLRLVPGTAPSPATFAEFGASR
jgi:hypothetical protein